MAAYGLYSHVQSNRRRSIALLIGLFFLVYVLVYAGALMAAALSFDADLNTLAQIAWSDLLKAAPFATAPDVFLDMFGQADPQKSRDSGLAIGVPGTVAGLTAALERYGSGKFTLAQLIAPAIKLAREGIAVEDDLLDSLLLAQPRLARWPSS